MCIIHDVPPPLRRRRQGYFARGWTGNPIREGGGIVTRTVSPELCRTDHRTKRKMESFPLLSYNVEVEMGFDRRYLCPTMVKNAHILIVGW